MTRTAKIEISGALGTPPPPLTHDAFDSNGSGGRESAIVVAGRFGLIYVAVVPVLHSERAGEDSDLRRLRLGGAIGKRGLRAAAQVSGAAGEMAGSGTSLVAGLHSSDQRVFEKFQATLQESVWRP
jgi:hypothetical protein